MKYACPCCGYKTLTHQPPGTFLICRVCFWEDDPVQYKNPSYRGGANKMSLTEAQESFRLIGAIDRESLGHVRRPLPDEK